MICLVVPLVKGIRSQIRNYFTPINILFQVLFPRSRFCGFKIGSRWWLTGTHWNRLNLETQSQKSKNFTLFIIIRWSILTTLLMYKKSFFIYSSTDHVFFTSYLYWVKIIVVITLFSYSTVLTFMKMTYFSMCLFIKV